MPATSDTLDPLRARYRAARAIVIESDLGPSTVRDFNAWIMGEVGRDPGALVAFAEGAAKEAQEYHDRVSAAEYQAMLRAEAYHRGFRDSY